jgi:hypothetical protein
MTFVDRIEFDTMPPDAERTAWCEWLRRHGIDPNVVLVPGWIERRPEAYQVAYLSAELDEETGHIRWDTERRVPVFVTAVAQLEGPPLPFPDPPRHPDDDFADAIKALYRAAFDPDL